MTLPLAGVSIALTRPPEQAATLSRAILAAGGQVLSFPLLDIVALEDDSTCLQAMTPVAQFDWVVFISSNAVAHGMPLLQQQGYPDRVGFAAIGPTTAAALVARGVARVLVPQARYDSESLLALPELQNMQGKRVLIVRGVGGRELLAETLRQRGAVVVCAECYRRVNPQTSSAPLQQAQSAGNLHGIVVTSSEALRHLWALAGAADWLKSIPLFVNHARIAEEAARLGLQTVTAHAPGDMEMLDVLSRYFNKS